MPRTQPLVSIGQLSVWLVRANYWSKYALRPQVALLRYLSCTAISRSSMFQNTSAETHYDLREFERDGTRHSECFVCSGYRLSYR